MIFTLDFMNIIYFIKEYRKRQPNVDNVKELRNIEHYDKFI